VFGEATWRPTSLVEVTVGSRYEKENRDRTGGAGVFLINYHRSFDAFLPRATVSLHTSARTTWGATVGRGYNAGGAGFAFNPPFPSFTYEKESVWNYEGFVRTSLLDNRLTLRANVFYNDYHGLQLPFDVAQNPSAPATVIRNADKATTYGAEVEARFAVREGLELKASGGLLKTKVNRYADPSVQGRDLPRSPAFQFTAGFFAVPIRNVDVSANVHYTDAYYSDVFNNARGKTSPYAEVSVQAGYSIGPARLFITVTNLLNKRIPVLITPVTNPANDVATMNRPRRVMGGIEASF
jgi:outer membrane receptor protein involved in Fe transport